MKEDSSGETNRQKDLVQHGIGGSTTTFLVAEFGKLREEIIFTIQGVVDCEKYAMFVTGAMWAFLANTIPLAASSSRHRGLYIVAAAVPVFLVALLKIKRDFLGMHTVKLGRYIRKIEDELIGPEAAMTKGLGWEHTLPAENLNSWVKYFWLIMLVGNLALAIWFILAVMGVT